MPNTPSPDVPQGTRQTSIETTAQWTFLSNFAHVLITIQRDPEIRQRDIALGVGITIGAVQRIVHELEVNGYIATERVGRRNHYRVLKNGPVRHGLEDNAAIEDFRQAVSDAGGASAFP